MAELESGESSGDDSDDSDDSDDDGDRVRLPKGGLGSSDSSQPIEALDAAAAGELGKLALPWLVFQHMANSLPADSASQLRCLRTCHDFPRTKPLRLRIEASILRTLRPSGEAAVGLASMDLSMLTAEHWSEAHAVAVRRGLKTLEAFVAGDGAGAADEGDDDGDSDGDGHGHGRSGDAGSSAVWEAYAGWIESLLRNPRVPTALALKLRRRCVSVSSRAHACGLALPRTYARWAVMRLLGNGGAKGLVGAPSIAEIATQPAALHRLVAGVKGADADDGADDDDEANAAADDDDDDDAADDGTTGGGVAASLAPLSSLQAALKICSAGLRRRLASAPSAAADGTASAPPPLLFAQLLLLIALHMQIGFSVAAADAGANAKDGIGGGAVAPEGEDAESGDVAPKRQKRLPPGSPDAGRLVASSWSPAGGLKAAGRKSFAVPPQSPSAPPPPDLLALLAPHGESALAIAQRQVSPAGRSAARDVRTAAAARAAEASELTLGIWTVWLRLAMATPDASRRPRAVLALLQRGVESLRPPRGAPLQALTAEWLCAMVGGQPRFSTPTVRTLAQLLVALPATPVETYEALLLRLAGSSKGAGTGNGAARPTSVAAPAASDASSAATRALFESAVAEHGHIASNVWQTYAAWHTGRGEFAQASAVHARALRSLDTSLHAGFVERSAAPH